jgi:hypothetical protein
MMKTILMSASSINGQADAFKSSANHTDTVPTDPSHQPRVLTDDEMDKVAGGIFFWAQINTQNVKNL